MTSLKQTLLAAAVALAATASAAQAGSYSIQVYNGTNPSPGNSGSTFEQALPGAGSIFATASLGTFNYTGNINFIDPTGGTDTIAAFLGSGTGSFATSIAGLTQTFSGAGFTNTTGLAITFTTTYAENLKITHDDGISLFSGSTNLIPGASAPTVAADTAVSIGPGTYTLYYIEANGLPAQLNVSVPEPVSMSLLGAGLIGLGMIRRRRARNAA